MKRGCDACGSSSSPAGTQPSSAMSWQPLHTPIHIIISMSNNNNINTKRHELAAVAQAYSLKELL
jgi:hypothetical protein